MAAFAIKLSRLRNLLRPLGKAVVAFSGGSDSSFLLKMCLDTLGRDNVLAVIAKSETYPERELLLAKRFARKIGAKYSILRTRELGNKNYRMNPADRCYHCKKELFSELKKICDKIGYYCVIDGSNLDDRKDTRPGTKARKELGVISPLEKAGFTKKDIRSGLRSLGLLASFRPPLACLASRIPYGTAITARKLRLIDDAEKKLLDLGFSQVRVRLHGRVARIEIPERELRKMVNVNMRKGIVRSLKSLGFHYLCVDLEGYRTGSMNMWSKTP